jgi:signal transduction histidine kinase
MALHLAVISIDDEASDSELLRRNLDAIEGWSIDFSSFTDATRGLAEAIRLHPDILFLDLLMEPRSGLELLRSVRASGYRSPIICLTGLEKTTMVVECLRAGAADYVPKATLNPVTLKKSIARAIQEHEIELALENRARGLQRTNTDLREKNDAIRRFYRKLTRELTGPLVAARNLTSLALDEAPEELGKGPENYLHFIRESVDEVVNLLEDLRDATEHEAGRLAVRKKVVSPGWLLRRVVAAVLPAAEREGVRVGLSVEHGLSDVLLDEDKVARVLSNLVRSAIKYTPSSESVSVRGQRSEDGAHLEILVQDTGIGNPQIDYLRELRPGESAESIRVGPSIHFCAEVARLHGGELLAEGPEGGGSCFRLLIPFECEPSPWETDSAEEKTRPEHEEAILNTPES